MPTRFFDFVSLARVFDSHGAILALIDNEVEPDTYSQAIKDARWRRATAEECKLLKIMGQGQSRHFLSGKSPLDVNGF